VSQKDPKTLRVKVAAQSWSRKVKSKETSLERGKRSCKRGATLKEKNYPYKRLVTSFRENVGRVHHVHDQRQIQFAEGGGDLGKSLKEKKLGKVPS